MTAWAGPVLAMLMAALPTNVATQTLGIAVTVAQFTTFPSRSAFTQTLILPVWPFSKSVAAQINFPSETVAAGSLRTYVTPSPGLSVITTLSRFSSAENDRLYSKVSPIATAAGALFLNVTRSVLMVPSLPAARGAGAAGSLIDLAAG